MIRVGVIGLGYWGPNLVRNLRETEDVEVIAVADMSSERGVAIARRYPELTVYADGDLVIGRDDLDAIVIATPAESHYELAKKALDSGRHVLVTKPLATSVVQAEELCALAERHELVLMIDHTFVYTAAVRKLKSLIDAEELGELLYVDSSRVNLGVVQPDVDVLWDLAVHDLSILLHLTNATPTLVSAVGADPIGVGRSSIAYLTCRYDDGLIAHVQANWLSPVKVRRMTVAGSSRMAVYDDVEPIEKIRIYDTGIDVDRDEAMIAYRTGDVWSPLLDLREALAVECDHFSELIRNPTVSALSGPIQGVAVVKVLDAARRSLENKGATIQL